MIVGITYLLTTLVVVWAITVGLQTLAAIFPYRCPRPHHPPVSTVIVVPAHNEELGISRCLRSVHASIGERTRVLVIADNCTDRTADLARAGGAEVIERHDMRNMGKPFALQFALEQLRRDPPEVVVFVDADGIVGGGSLTEMAAMAHASRRPVQALNLVDRKRSARALAAFSVLGNRFHNLVRPLGNLKLGLPCLLMGSGMAIPWPAIERVGRISAGLGEDKQLGVDLAIAGWPPRFFPLTKISSRTPTQVRDYLAQRKRWEQGHLVTAARAIPRLLATGLVSGRMGLLTLAAELFVPPVAVIVLTWMLATFFALMIPVAHGALGGLALAALAFVVSLGVSWWVFCRRLPLRTLALAPLFVLRKLPMYLAMVAKGRQNTWVRSERGP